MTGNSFRFELHSQGQLLYDREHSPKSIPPIIHRARMWGEAVEKASSLLHLPVIQLKQLHFFQLLGWVVFH